MEGWVRQAGAVEGIPSLCCDWPSYAFEVGFGIAGWVGVGGAALGGALRVHRLGDEVGGYRTCGVDVGLGVARGRVRNLWAESVAVGEAAA